MNKFITTIVGALLTASAYWVAISPEGRAQFLARAGLGDGGCIQPSDRTRALKSLQDAAREHKEARGTWPESVDDVLFDRHLLDAMNFRISHSDDGLVVSLSNGRVGMSLHEDGTLDIGERWGRSALCD